MIKCPKCKKGKASQLADGGYRCTLCGHEWDRPLRIADLLKREDCSVRVSCGNVWLIWDDAYKTYKVYEHEYYKRHPTVREETQNESEACAAFLRAAQIEDDPEESPPPPDSNLVK